MNIYIFPAINQLTDNHHSGGGLVIIAKSRKGVDDIVKKSNGDFVDSDDNHRSDPVISVRLDEKDWASVVVRKLVGKAVKPKIYIMPDAGCC